VEFSPLVSAEGAVCWPRPLTVGLSISGAEDAARFGLGRGDLDSMFGEVTRSLRHAGVVLAYGGHLKTGGHTGRLADFVLERPLDEAAWETRSGPGAVVYWPWPRSRAVRPPATWAPAIEVRHCERPSDIDETLDPTFTASPTAEISASTALGRLAWARGLSVMRERQTSEVVARVVMGGRVGTAGGYLGRMPGVLEETLLALRAGQPVFLIAALGGCARLVADALDGVERRELTWDYHRVVPHSRELRHFYAARGLAWDDYENVADELCAIGFAGLGNGLTIEENRELVQTRSGPRAAELVLRGLERCYPSLTYPLSARAEPS